LSLNLLRGKGIGRGRDIVMTLEKRKREPGVGKKQALFL